jgi:predicted PurR-regulated permease PerM
LEVNQAWLATAFFFALLLIILYGAFLILTPFLKAITWAVILAILVYPVYAWLLRKLQRRATTAALIVIVGITLLVIVPGFELAWFLADETVALVQTVRSMLSDEGLAAWKQGPYGQRLVALWDLVSFQLMDFKINWKEVLLQGAQASSGFLVVQVKGVAQNVLLVTVNFIIALITLFFLLRDGAGFFRRVQRLLPMDREHQQRLFKNITDTVLAVVHGSLVVAMIQGLLAGTAYWLAGVPFAVLWGVLTAFTSLLPVGGSTLVSIPVSIYMFVIGEPLKGVLLLLWCLGFVGTIDNVLKPLLIGNRLGLPVLFLFFGILGGLALFGALGIVLGPVIFALLRALLDLYIEEYSAAEPRKERSGPGEG